MPNGMNIGKDGKFDLTRIKQGGLTAQEIKEITKFNPKLIDIFKNADTDGDDNLSELELSLAMDGFVRAADTDGDGKLSRKERKEYAESLEGDVRAKDVRKFVKTMDKIKYTARTRNIQGRSKNGSANENRMGFDSLHLKVKGIEHMRLK